jgi:SAM-dependent methyltransferase
MKNPYALKKVLDDQDARGRLSHDVIYDDGYFQFVEKTTAQSANVIAKSIIRSFHPSTLVDVGCGTGALLECLREEGVTVKGLEYAEAALKSCRKRRLVVLKFDVMTDPLPLEFTNADVVVSMEVGQQLVESSSDRYVDMLCEIAPVVIFSSGTPGQGDRKPINEQPHSYWIERFSQRGFRFDERLSLHWREDWKNQGIARWFCNNVMIFSRDNLRMWSEANG